MNILLLREFLDSCQEVKKLTEWFPKLPAGLTQRHMKVVGIIHELAAASDCVRVSDISDALRGTRPSVTRLIQELERHGAVRKQPDDRDRRIIRLTLTELGERYYTYYCIRYQNWMADVLDDIPPEQLETTIATIHQIYEIMNAQWKERNDNFGTI